MLGLRVILILDDGHFLHELIDSDAFPLTVVVAGHMATLTGLGVGTGGAELGLILAVEPLQIGHLFQRARVVRPAIDHGQLNGVATAAQAWGLEVRVEFRRDPDGIDHRVRRHLVVPVGTKDGVGRSHLELARDRVLQEVFEGRHAGWRDIGHRPVADRAADAVPGQRAVLEVGIAAVGELQELELEVAGASGGIRVELPLAHRAMTLQTGVSERAGHLLVPRRRKGIQVGEFAFQLGEEDRIPPGQAHGRPAPFAVRGDIGAGDHVGRRQGRRQEHRGAKGPGEPSVTRHALARADVLPAHRRRHHVIERFGRHRLDARQRYAGYRREGLQELLVHMPRGKEMSNGKLAGVSDPRFRSRPPGAVIKELDGLSRKSRDVVERRKRLLLRGR